MEVRAPRELFRDSPGFPIGAIDFFLKTCAFGCAVPAPTPAVCGADPRAMAEFVYGHFGREAQFAASLDQAVSLRMTIDGSPRN